MHFEYYIIIKTKYLQMLKNYVFTERSSVSIGMADIKANMVYHKYLYQLDQR